MSRLRGQSKSLLWLVLVALLIQLPLAALHSHAYGGHDQASASAANTSEQPAPYGGTDKDKDEGLCPICWSIATASAALMAPPPAAVSPPVSLIAPFHPVLTKAVARLTDVTAFDARGPPEAATSAYISG